jgi:hypothetical protein
VEEEGFLGDTKSLLTLEMLEALVCVKKQSIKGIISATFAYLFEALI